MSFGQFGLNRNNLNNYEMNDRENWQGHGCSPQGELLSGVPARRSLDHRISEKEKGNTLLRSLDSNKRLPHLFRL